MYARFLPRTTLPLQERNATAYRGSKSSLSISLPQSLSRKPYSYVTVLGYGLGNRASFPVLGTLREPISSGTVVLRYNDVVASLLPQERRDRHTTVTLRSLRLSFPNSEQTVSYASEGYILNGAGALLKSAPLFINGGDSIVWGIELRGAKAGIVTASWPKALADKDQPKKRARSLRLMLTPSGSCPSDSPVDVSVTVSIDGASHTYQRHTNLADAVDVPFDREVSARSPISIAVDGKGACHVDETLDSLPVRPHAKPQPTTFAVRAVEVH